MQSTKSRIALLAAAAVAAVAAFLVLSPEDDESSPTAVRGPVTPADGAAAGHGARNRAGAERSQPEATRIEIRDGRVPGGVERIEAERGETIEFVVTSDAPEDIHVHGYELTQHVKPGQPARFRLTADLEGVYEVEAHDIGHVPVAELRVGG